MKWNGTCLPLPKPQTVSQFLEEQGYHPLRVAVERNGQVVRREDFDHTFLTDQDTIEVVQFVGGG